MNGACGYDALHVQPTYIRVLQVWETCVALKLIINMPIRNVARSTAFWQALGYAFDARYATDSVCSLILGDDMIAMLHVDAGFVANTDRAIADPHTNTSGQWEWGIA